MRKLTAFFCVICIVTSVMAFVPAAAAGSNWSGWSGSSYSIRDGVVYLGNNGQFKKSMTLPDNYTVKATVRVTKWPSGSIGFQVMNGKYRTGIYLGQNQIGNFGGQYAACAVETGWHDWRIEVKGNSHAHYMDGMLIVQGTMQEYGASGNVQFFMNGDGKLEIESFEIITEKTEGHDGSLMIVPQETEYVDEFTVNWSDPESYKDWMITPSPDIKIDGEKGILTLDVDGNSGYYQIERAPLIPDNFDFEFDLQMEKYGSKDFQFKATHPGRNNYQTLREDRMTMTSEEHRYSGGMGINAEIGNDWHHWKMEVRGDFVTLYLDGGELYRFEQALAPSQQSLLRFLLTATPNDSYRIHLGSIHYKPYYEDIVLKGPRNGSEYVEGSDVLFKADVKEDLEYVDFFVNDLNIGRGYAPNYEYVMKNAKLGSYRVSVGIGEQKGVESVITVKKGFNAHIVADKTVVNYGESVVVSLNAETLQGLDSVKPSKVEYFVNGHSVGTSVNAPFACEIKASEIGTTAVYAQVSNDNGAHYMTEKYLIDVVSDGKDALKIGREYEIEYDFNGDNAELRVNDGYFELNMKHINGKLVYESNKGTREAELGKGRYRIVTTSGLADVYYNGHFAASWYMPRTSTANEVKYSGLSNFKIGGTDVKAEYFHKEWEGISDFVANLPIVPRNYSVEFDKTDLSDETIAFYDGEYEIKLEFKDGAILTQNQDVEKGYAVPFTLAGTAKPGYYRVTVAKGLAQVWIDNIYVDSFAAPQNSRPAQIVRKMTNPSASTIVAVKGTNDMYYYEDDFSGNTELNSLDYWIPDEKSISASIAGDSGNPCMKLEGNGDFYLNAQSDDVWMEWSAKISDTDVFYVAPRVFRGPYYHINAGYDYTKNKWFVRQWAKEAYYPVDISHEFDGVKPVQNVWHNFELSVEECELILKMDGQTVIKTDKIDMPFWGYTGFGIEGGSVLIDNVNYSGKCKPAAIYSATISDPIGISEFYQRSDGDVVAMQGYAYSWKTSDDGKTWTEPFPTGAFDSNTIRLQDGRLFALWGESNGNVWGMVSLDDGATWTKTGDMNSTARTAPRRVILTGSIIQDSTGRIHVACDETYTESVSHTGLYYTDDFGKTWSEAETVMGIDTKDGIDTTTTGYNFQEGSMTELPDGTIRYFARTGLGYLYYMDSHDRGKNWGEFRPSQFINPLCSFAVERDNENPNTYYAAIEYDATTYCYRYQHSPRNRFALMVSYDGMESWEFVMTLNEWADFPLFDACNHTLRVFDDTLYINWNNLHAPRRSFIYTVKKDTIRSSKRFEEIHERIFRGAMGGETFDSQVMLSKTSGTGIIYGNSLEFGMKNQMYEPKIVGQIFGAEYTVLGDDVIFRIGDGTVRFTGNSTSYEKNGVTKNFGEVCMKDGYLNIKACAQAFGKAISEDENSYVLWYGTPLTEQYLKGYLECI